MVRSVLPGNDQFARQCPTSYFVDRETLKELAPKAFQPNPDNPEISGNWFEFYVGDTNVRLDLVCKNMAADRDVGASHKIALIEANRIAGIGSQCGRSLEVQHDPLPDNESHAIIVGIPLDDAILHQELADVASEKLKNAIAYKRRSPRTST